MYYSYAISCSCSQELNTELFKVKFYDNTTYSHMVQQENYVYMYMHMYICIYLSTYLWREREGKQESEKIRQREEKKEKR